MPKFFYYFLQTANLEGMSTNPTRPSLTQAILDKVSIQLPPLKLQFKIVEILDKFQALTEDVSGLLPEEIALRE
ncbi:restriction endonuclease subunit S, partial [Mycobacterium kansasii]